MYAHITTDADGRLTKDSTCTIDGVIVPVPVRTEPDPSRCRDASEEPFDRITAAVRALDWEVVDFASLRLDRRNRRYELLVDLPGAGA